MNFRIGIAGCGRAAKIHSRRLVEHAGVEIAGLADVDIAAAEGMTSFLSREGDPIPCFGDHREMLASSSLDALAVFTPHRTHYRLAMDGLQAGCHVFIERPLTTNAQEADDIVGLARGRNRVVAIGHQYRLLPSLIQSREQIAGGALGELRLISATMCAPWLARHQEKSDAWRLDPKLSGGGILADTGSHLLDAILWTTGQVAIEVAAFQSRIAPGLDVVTAATVRLSNGSLVTLGLSGVASETLFELKFLGELGQIVATDRGVHSGLGQPNIGSDSLHGTQISIDDNFVRAILTGTPPCCPAEEAIPMVRLMEAIARSATSGQVVKLT